MSNIINEGEDKLDIDTGYFTREAFLEGSKACELFEEGQPQIIKDTKKIIKGRIWYLTTITIPAGTLFPDGAPDEYDWVVAPVVGIEDPEKYPIPDKPGEFFSTRIGVEDAKKFKEFKEGLVYLGML
tara:strand:+ start:290 stop:670 length:381 start_codon:yes stop_codon:yes gene_type:complete